MKRFDFMSAVTGTIVVTMQIASGVALYVDRIDWQDYRDLWGPLLGLMLGYWFRDGKDAA